MLKWELSLSNLDQEILRLHQSVRINKLFLGQKYGNEKMFIIEYYGRGFSEKFKVSQMNFT